MNSQDFVMKVFSRHAWPLDRDELNSWSETACLFSLLSHVNGD